MAGLHPGDRPGMADLAEAGLSTEAVLHREPYPGVEVETKRAYVYARVSDL